MICVRLLQVGLYESCTPSSSRSSSQRRRRHDSDASLPLLIARGEPSSFPGSETPAPRPAFDSAPRSY